MSDETTGASEQVEDTKPECFPIFQQFSRETLIEMVALPWKPTEGASNLSPRADVVVKLENTGETPEQVCPLAFCLWKEGKAWTEYKDESGEWHYVFSASPDDASIAAELVGVPARAYQILSEDAVPDKDEAKFEELTIEAAEFIKRWDAGMIDDLAAAACLNQPA